MVQGHGILSGLAGAEVGVARHPELFGQGRPGCSLGPELFYELLVLFELVLEQVCEVEGLDVDVLIAALAEQGVAMRLVPSLQLFSLVEDVVRFDAVLLVPLLGGTERLAGGRLDAGDAVEPFE